MSSGAGPERGVISMLAELYCNEDVASVEIETGPGLPGSV